MTDQVAFLVSSALNTKFGVFSKDQRLQQTLATLKSIRLKVPTAIIALIESSGKSSIDPVEVDELSKYVDVIMDYSKDQVIKQVHDTTEIADIVKNFTELWAFNQALKKISVAPDSDILSGVTRIFKISGRYLLNNDFDISHYQNNEKIVFSKRRNSQFPCEVTGGVTQQFMSRLWSWPVKNILEVSYTYDKMVKEFIKANAEQHYLDIEHLLFKNFGNHVDLQELDKIGVHGQLGPNGVIVAD